MLPLEPMVQKVVHIFFTERSWWSAYAKIVLWGESVLLERDIVVRLLLKFRFSYKMYMIKCFRSGIPNAMPTNLCQVRKMCSFLVIADGFLSSIVRKAREALHLHPLILVLIGENCNKKKCLPLFRFILPTSRPSVMACSAFTPQTCHISSIHKYSTMCMLHMNVVLVSAKNGHKCLLLRT